MTSPTITHGVGDQDDLGDRTNYSADGANDDGMTSTLTVDSGTVFNIAVSAAVGNKKTYYELDITDIPAATNTQGIVKYKTSSATIKARVELVFDDATTEFVTGLIQSITWTTESWTISAGNQGKIISKIRLWAYEDTGDVYYDFWSIFTGTQTFHNVNSLDVNPRIKKAVLPIPGRDTDVSQHLGRANTLITLEGPMRAGKDWSADYASSSLKFGEFLKQLLSEKKFQWFTSDGGQFKVMPVPDGFHFKRNEAQGFQLHYVIQLEEYDVGDASVFGSPAWFDMS